MVRFPWSTDRDSDGGAPAVDRIEGDTVVSCEFQDGTLVVSEEEIYIERRSRSKFTHKRIPLGQIRDVTYAERLFISYIQIEQDGFDHSEASLLSTPVDENTLHFGRGKRECARRATDAILADITAP